MTRSRWDFAIGLYSSCGRIYGMALAIIGTFTVIAGTVAYLLVKINREHDEESEHIDESSFNK